MDYDPFFLALLQLESRDESEVNPLDIEGDSVDEPGNLGITQETTYFPEIDKRERPAEYLSLQWSSESQNGAVLQALHHRSILNVLKHFV